jgi:TctA family transporter
MGIVSGILPGVSVSTALLILTPWLLDWSAQAIVFFYIAAMITSQINGSVSAILFGVPGEVSSLPTVQEHARIQQFGLTNTLIAGTAICSVLGGGLAMLITYLSLLGINFFYGYFNHLIQSMIMLLVIGLLAVTGNNKWFVNVALIVFFHDV